jgi:hypothetical protein
MRISMRLVPITLLLVSTASAQTYDAKAIYQKMLTAEPSPEEVSSASAQIFNLPKAYVRDLIPSLLAAIKAGHKSAAAGLYSLSRRPDSGDLLKPYMNDIVEFLASPDGFYQQMASTVFLNMSGKPQPPEAAEALLGFINGPIGTTTETTRLTELMKKINALTCLTRLTNLQNPPKDRIEAAAIRILKQPMPDHILGSAIQASMYPGASDKMMDVVAQYFTHASRSVQAQTIYAMRCFGPASSVERYRGQLTKMAHDPSAPPAIRQLAQDALDGRDEKCFAIQWDPPKLIPIPGCKTK